MLAAALAFALVCRAPQASGAGAGGGLESLLQALTERTAARREAAREGWKQNGPQYLAEPNERSLQALLPFAPEIQEPVLEALERDPSAVDGSLALVQLLAVTMNAAGAQRLEVLLPRLPDACRPAALEAVAARGDARTLAGVVAMLEGGAGVQREAALAALLAYGPLEQVPAWLAQPGLLDLSGNAWSAALARLAARPLPDGLRLPAALYERRDTVLAQPLLQILQQAPDPAAEPFLLRVLEQTGQERDTRLLALQLLESGTVAFHWHEGEKRLEQWLEQKPPDPLVDEFAWCLHRLGNKNGTKYLLAVPLAAVKSNPRNWRNRFALGRTYVDLGDFAEAYTQFAEGVDLVEGTPNFERVSAQEWVYAARAAAGARRLRDAGTWLEDSGLSSSELKPYQELPEFAALLDRQPFKRLFGLD